MEKESIQLVVLFEQRRVDPQAIIKFSEELLSGLYHAGFHELSYSLLINNNLKSKSLKYTKNSIDKFLNEKPFNGFELLNLLPDWKYKSKDIQFSLRYTPDFNDKCSAIVSTLNKESFFKLYNRQKLVDVYLSMINFLKGQGAVLTYGFIFSMDSEKFPAMFVAGVGNYILTGKEEELLQIWAEKNNECDTKIWDIFWGNLVTSKHFRDPQAIDKVKAIAGESNFYIIDSSTYFFHSPADNLLLGEEDRQFKRALKGLFNFLKE